MFRNDKANYFSSASELMATFKDIIENKIEPNILKIFHNKPTTKLEIVEVCYLFLKVQKVQYYYCTSMYYKELYIILQHNEENNIKNKQRNNERMNFNCG